MARAVVKASDMESELQDRVIEMTNEAIQQSFTDKVGFSLFFCVWKRKKSSSFLIFIFSLLTGYCFLHQKNMWRRVWRSVSAPSICSHFFSFQVAHCCSPRWHCFVGRNFACFVTHESKNFVYFYIGQTGVCVFKTVPWKFILAIFFSFLSFFGIDC